MQAAGGASLSDAGGPAQEDRVARPLRARRVGVLVAVAACVWAADQAAKWLAVDRLTGRAAVDVVGGVLRLRLIRNSGAAFGLAGGMTVLLTLVAVGVVVAVLRTASRLRSTGWALALGLLLGGALGNLTDRLLRAPGVLRGHVVDFLELPHWPVFNLADSAIVTASVLMVALSVRGEQVDGRRDGDAPAQRPDGMGVAP